MTLETNKGLSRAAIALWSTGDERAAGEIFAPDYVMHQHHDPHGSQDLDLKGLLGFLTRFRETFPDLSDRIDMQVAEGDHVATRFVSTGTQTGAYGGVAPSGKTVAWSGTVIDRIEGGRIKESWGDWDLLGMLQQIGAVAR